MLSKGVRYMLLASFFFALMNVFVKWVPHISAIEIVFFRSLVSFVLTWGMLRRVNVPLLGSNMKLLIFRGLAGASGLILYFITLQAIPLASAVTIQYLSPIFASVLGVLLVKERVHPLQWMFFGVAFLGTLMVQGFDTRVTWVFGGIGVAGAFFSGLAYSIIRKIGTREHPLVIVFYFPLVTLPITALYSVFHWVTPHGWDWGVLLVIGITTQIAQYFMTKAYQSDDISKVSSLKYIGIIYALIFGFFLFDERFNMATHVGMVVVLLGVGLNVWYKNRKTRQALEAKA
jgi:drug/metabolite transporter (DMT)-like permease